MRIQPPDSTNPGAGQGLHQTRGTSRRHVVRRHHLPPPLRADCTWPTVIDLASRQVLGWSMSDAHDAGLVVDASTRSRPAAARRWAARSFTPTRGAAYTSAAAQACARLGLRRSMGRTGSCLDNAVAESFFASLKVEVVDRYHYQTRAGARTAVFRWLACYNNRRLHSTIGYRKPREWELAHRATNVLESDVAA